MSTKGVKGSTLRDYRSGIGGSLDWQPGTQLQLLSLVSAQVSSAASLLKASRR